MKAILFLIGRYITSRFLRNAKTSILLLFFLSATITALCQSSDESRYSPPKNSPFGKDTRTSFYSDSENGSLKLMIGLPVVSFLKGEIALQSIITKNDFSYKFRFGVPYKLNRFDLSNFWDENVLLWDDDDGRASIKEARKMLTTPVKGISTGAGIRYTLDDNFSGTGFVEVEYGILTNNATIDPSKISSASNPHFKSIRHDLSLSGGRSMTIGKWERLRLFAEESLGIGIGYLSATRFNESTTYNTHVTSSERVNFFFPYFYIQANIGIVFLKR